MPTFSLLTLNCFGVPTPTTHPRLLALARELNARDDQIVCLQEVQSHAYRRLLMRACDSYPHAAYAPFVHAPKGGLLTLARLPLAAVEFTLYRSREVPYPLSLMDWLLHKGILATRLEYAGVSIVVLNTHLNANYGGNWDRRSSYTRSEAEQLRQLADIVRAQPPEALVVAAGDFNFPRDSWLYEEFLAASGMLDPLAGDTRPTVRAPLKLAKRYALPIDFALVRAPALAGLRMESELRFVEKVRFSGRPRFLSDHMGVELR
ncbi:MAG TPA: endonuclease/exonuclease/phosphatase family protein, partial [Roseiflexaceae bacterium]|nr:endonuclease/exonuclease/phosphatase family protein [Roseiflexaceae bacterium]